MHGAIVESLCTGILRKKLGSDVIGLARVCQREQRAGAGNHAVTLVLAVGRVADFFCEGVIGVLQGTHHWSMDADV